MVMQFKNSTVARFNGPDHSVKLFLNNESAKELGVHKNSRKSAILKAIQKGMGKVFSKVLVTIEQTLYNNRIVVVLSCHDRTNSFTIEGYLDGELGYLLGPFIIDGPGIYDARTMKKLASVA